MSSDKPVEKSAEKILDKAIIKNLIHLSRIDCTDEEQAHLLDHLKRMIAYIETLEELDTQNVEPCYQIVDDEEGFLRKDIIGETLKRELFLANAPSQIGGMIRVPTIIKQSKKIS